MKVIIGTANMIAEEIAVREVVDVDRPVNLLCHTAVEAVHFPIAEREVERRLPSRYRIWTGASRQRSMPFLSERASFPHKNHGQSVYEKAIIRYHRRDVHAGHGIAERIFAYITSVADARLDQAFAGQLLERIAHGHAAGAEYFTQL